MKDECRRSEPLIESMDVYSETRCTAESSCCLKDRCRFVEYDAVWLPDYDEENPWKA